ncbi:MAG: membrane protein insertase YidC, partial [Acidobacteria bacterium]|nr:membrane protein insertase YidC [Acidobacteriota bacterium]
TKLYRIVFSNRGATVRSWILKQYKDGAGIPVDLVNQKAGPLVAHPFSYLFPRQKPTADLNQALFAAKQSPAGIEFEYSDGSTTARKAFEFKADSYLSEFRSDVTQGGGPLPHLIAWHGGFGDFSIPNAFGTQHSVYYDTTNAKLEVKDAKEGKNGPVSAHGTFSFAGLEDNYFAAVFLPPDSGTTQLDTWSHKISVQPDPKEAAKEEFFVGAAVGGSAANHFSVFVGPKDLDLLKRINPKLSQIVDFGWFALLARPLFLSLNWVNDHVIHNYGWSIVLVTVIINVLLLPLRMTSMKSMKKMQLLQPQIASINEKYKGLGMRDPKKAEQNQEVMDLYKKNGVNPMGGCMPMVLQIPFFIAFYKVLSVAIEMRGANWLWVTDLSQPEHLPIRILPVAMIASQFLQQKMTPPAGGDPTQQRMMMFMPLMLGFMFYGVSSGLVLYWFTGNLVGIVQQWLFNRASHPVVSAPAGALKKKGSKK